MSLYTILSPDLSHISPERMKYLTEQMYHIYFGNNLEKYCDEKYYPWDKVKFLALPKELESHEELWFIIRSLRYGRATPVKNIDGSVFKLKKVNFLEELLHNLDLSL